MYTCKQWNVKYKHTKLLLLLSIGRVSTVLHNNHLITVDPS